MRTTFKGRIATKPKKYLDFAEYSTAADSLYSISRMILFSFAKHECDTKHLIIRNFVARAAMMIKAIFKLWEISDYQDAWIIYRALLDRLFHLYELAEKDEFCEFEDWSFFEQYKAQNKAKSDPEFKHESVGWVYELTDEQKRRIESLSAKHPKWRRPKAEYVAKSMGMEFLYKYGYDFSSTHVHPMANDGEQDFYTITKLKPTPRFPDQTSVLSDSLLVDLVLIQKALNYSGFRWRRLLWDCLELIGRFLDNGDLSYMESFLKLARMFRETELCEKKTT